MGKLNREQFVLTGMEKLRTGKQRGLRVNDALDQAFTEYFGPKASLMPTLSKMGRDGKIALHKTGKPGKEHMVVYKAGEQPKPKATPEGVLAAMGLKVRKVRKATPAHVEVN